MVRLTIRVIDALDKAPIPYTHVELVPGPVLSTAIDGAAVFEVNPCQTYVIKIRHSEYRPYTRSVHLLIDTPVVVELERIRM